MQSIALILANRPDSKPKTTLIVAPVSLLSQWKDEIEKKTNCEPRLRVLVHQGGKRTKGEGLANRTCILALLPRGEQSNLTRGRT